jgi:hypothetical protein
MSRVPLLNMLQERCREVGVALNHLDRIEPAAFATRFPDSDIIVAADGISAYARRRESDVAELAPFFQPPGAGASLAILGSAWPTMRVIAG